MPESINNFLNLLETIPTLESEYEFKTFFLEKYPTPARQLIAVLEQIKNLQNELRDSTDKKTALQAKIDMMTAWVNSLDNPQKILENYEDEEPEYWAHVLGRTAAIEIVSIGKTSKETMERMSLLPIEDFEDCVKICVRFATLIRETTSQVEKELEDIEINVIKI